MEEIDMDLSRVYDAMGVGFNILAGDRMKEKERIMVEEKKRIMVEEKKRDVMETRIISKLDPVLLPYASVIDVVKTDYGELFGWIEISIPEFALITLSTHEKGNRLEYCVHNPSKIKGDITIDYNWHDTCLHQGIKDSRLALALAKEAWNYYLKTIAPQGKSTNEKPVEKDMSAGEGHPKAEVYGPVDGEFGSFQVDEGYVQLLVDKRLKEYGLI